MKFSIPFVPFLIASFSLQAYADTTVTQPASTTSPTTVIQPAATVVQPVVADVPVAANPAAAGAAAAAVAKPGAVGTPRINGIGDPAAKGAAVNNRRRGPNGVRGAGNHGFRR